MVFGLCNSPATYARVINLVLRGLNWKVVMVFLDDILVLGWDFEGLSNECCFGAVLRFYFHLPIC
jgi:hypothetical protein